MEKLSSGTVQDDFAIEFTQSGSQSSITFSPDTVFSNIDVIHFPMTECELKTQGCSSAFTETTHISMNPDPLPTEIKVSTHFEAGFDHTLCVSCTNSLTTKTLDNWNIR